jgi:hypothetical protein
MPGYPKEWHEVWAVFSTRQTVRMVPAAPCRDATSTAAVWSEQSGVAGVDVLDEELEDVLVVDSLLGAGSEEAGAVGTGPASWAPFPSQPASSTAKGRSRRANDLVMGRSVTVPRNPDRAAP